MQDVVDKIRLDMDKPLVRTSVSVCKGDTITRIFRITLLKSGVVYDIPNNAIATFWAVKPDGHRVYNDCVIQGNEISYTVTNQLIAQEGTVVCRIKLTMPNDEVIQSPIFHILVYEQFFDESILESTNDYSALQTYCIRAENAAKEAEETANEIRQMLKNVCATGIEQ